MMIFFANNLFSKRMHNETSICVNCFWISHYFNRNQTVSNWLSLWKDFNRRTKMKAGIIPVSFVVLVLIENVNACMCAAQHNLKVNQVDPFNHNLTFFQMILGALPNRPGTGNKSTVKTLATSTAKSGKMIRPSMTTTKRSSWTVNRENLVTFGY